MAAATAPIVYPASKGNPSEYKILGAEINALRANTLFLAWKGKA